MSQKKATPLQTASAPGEQDEFHGIGGSYTVNPASGKRELVHRTQEADPAAVEQPVTENTENAPAQA